MNIKDGSMILLQKSKESIKNTLNSLINYQITTLMFLSSRSFIKLLIKSMNYKRLIMIK